MDRRLSGHLFADAPPDRARDTAKLALLTVLAVALFSAVSGLSRVYQTQQASLGNRWFTRGMADLNARQFDSAVKEFRAALLYSRDNYTYQAYLARALIGDNRIGEASAYLSNLWERQPEDGMVNLELARISAQKPDSQQALRYYHNAIYASWPGNEERVQRHDARVELIEYLLRINAKAQAESELIALEANLGEESSEQAQAGDLFIRTQDYERALAAYRASLKADRRNQQALAGAGLAAFELGLYPIAQRYLQSAVSANSDDTGSAELLKTTEMVLQMDPFQRGISVAQRHQIVVRAFAVAGDRLKNCPPTSGMPSNTKTGNAKNGAAQTAAAPANLTDSWAKMKPQITEVNLRKDPDLVETAMDLVFNIERQTSLSCGSPQGADLALLLISKLHEGA
jgi:tetratricopeptide (TPR) repeat protein